MERRNLSSTDLTVSRLCLGTMTFGGQCDEAASKLLVERSLDAGIDFFDTANVYNQGRSEEILGRAIGPRRKGVVLASKVRGKMGDGPQDSGLSRAAVRKAVEGSLRRLGTDYLDLYYLHQPDYSVPIEETIETVEELVREGKVRYPASSNYASWQVCRMLCLAESRGWRPARITQPMYNLLARGLEQEFLPMAREMKVSTVVYNPLAGGLLSGKHSRDQPAGGSRFETNEMYRGRYWHHAMHDAVEELSKAAQEAGRSLVSLSLNWLLHHSPADCIILGASGAGQLAENLRACDEGPLPAETVVRCDAVWAKLRGVTPQYNR